MKLSKFFNSKTFYRIISLIFALMLFLYVNSMKLNTTRFAQNGDVGVGFVNKATTLRVPVRILANQNGYFVTGYPSMVKVRVTGPSSLVTAARNTHSLQVTADCTHLGLGNHTVKLQPRGFNHDLSVQVEPSRVNLTVSRRETADFPVQVRFNSRKIAKGYAAGRPTASVNVVSATGPAKDINRIDCIVARVKLSKHTRETVHQQVALQAVDANGQPLSDVILSYKMARVTVPIFSAKSTKSVNVQLVKSGKGVKGNHYSFTTDTKNVTVHGSKQALDKLTTLKVPVAVAGIDGTMDKTIALSPTQYGITGIDPATIKVHVTVTKD